MLVRFPKLAEPLAFGVVGEVTPTKTCEIRGKELIGAITHLALYAGWPKSMSATAAAKRLFRAEPARES